MDNIGPGGVGMNLDVIKTCARCGLRYDWRNSSTSSLKMTYCSTLCERYDRMLQIEMSKLRDFLKMGRLRPWDRSPESKKQLALFVGA